MEPDVMKKLLLALIVTFVPAAVFAADNCEEIKNQIDARIKAQGVAVYKLQIVDADSDAKGKTVGTCDAGKKKIVYWKP
jgi:hypothetical protein